MKNLTIAQKAYLAILVTVAGAWLALALGVPVYEYQHGKSALTVLLTYLASILKFAVFGILLLAWVLQRIGILPTVQADPALERGMSSTRRWRNLALWIVIALFLVFLFNLFQGSKGGGNHAQVTNLTQAPTPGLATILINWFPMLIIFAVWIFFFRQMKGRQGKDTDKTNNS